MYADDTKIFREITKQNPEIEQKKVTIRHI